ncbi:MAG TPA: DUF4139 domain-containing protein [Puia sp.]|nr:DUF4139 domain-containing protein [Puia sp.]
MRIIFFVVAMLLFSNAFTQIKKLNAETSIQNVTIFSSGARVERSSTVSIQAGRSEISFAGLSNQLDEQTVQLKADANITLLSVQSAKDFLSARKIEQEEKNLTDQTNSYKDKLDMDTKLLDVYKNEEAMLIKNQAIGGQSGIKATDLKESLDLQRQRLTEVYGKQLEIQKRLITDQQDYDKTTLQLNEISRKKDSINYIVTALIDSKETRTVNFQLLYNVKDAGWFPAYDVRVNNVTEPLSVLMNANVFQRSGETWKNVSLFLSTGNPNDNATPSILQPWMLGFYDPSVAIREQNNRGVLLGRVTDDKNQPIPDASVTVQGTVIGAVTDVNGFFRVPNVSNKSMMVVTSVGFESKEFVAKPGYLSIVLERSSTALNQVVIRGYASELAGKVAGVYVTQYKKDIVGSIQTVSVTTQYQPTTTVFKIDDKYTLETDGKTTTIGIKQFEIPAIYDYYTAPKVDPSAFLTAKIISWQDYNLQSGEASLYFEGTYLGKTYIDLDATVDTLSLSLGKDNAVKISRKLVKEFSSKKFIGSNRTDTREYEISVRNTKPVPVNITVLDQIPVSVNKEISVDDLKAPDAQIDKDNGIVTWKIILPPGQERKLQVGYSVKYPKDKKVVLE